MTECNERLTEKPTTRDVTRGVQAPIGYMLAARQARAPVLLPFSCLRSPGEAITQRGRETAQELPIANVIGRPTPQADLYFEWRCQERLRRSLWRPISWDGSTKSPGRGTAVCGHKKSLWRVIQGLAVATSSAA